MTPATESRIVELLERIVAALERDKALPSALVDAEEFAHHIGVHVRSLRRMRHEDPGFPKPRMLGRRLRWRRADMDAYVNGRKQ